MNSRGITEEVRRSFPRAFARLSALLRTNELKLDFGQSGYGVVASLEQITELGFVPHIDLDGYQLGKAPASRKLSFVAGRLCAEAAFSATTGDTSAIRRGNRGEPLWPNQTVGSISHDEMLAWAVVARAGNGLRLGVDVQRVISLEGVDAVRRHCFGQDELDLLEDSGLEVCTATTLGFSCKEAYFKSISSAEFEPFINFRNVRIQAISLASRTFVVHSEGMVDTLGRPMVVNGMFNVTPTQVFASVVLRGMHSSATSG